MASLRFRLADLHWSKCLRPPRVRKTLPVDVTLKRLATDLRVLLRAMGFGMRKGQEASEFTCSGNQKFCKGSLGSACAMRRFALLQSDKSDLIKIA